jgi:hypothetical protein
MKKNVGVGLIVVGGLLAAAAVANIESANLPISITSKIPVVPTGNNKYNAAIGVALAVVGFYLRK